MQRECKRSERRGERPDGEASDCGRHKTLLEHDNIALLARFGIKKFNYHN